MRSPAVIRELGPAAFLAEINELMAVYAAAMNAASGDLPVRRSIMERHSSDPDFRALAVSAEPAGPVIAFAYGFRGEAGQWWHDVVMSGITAAAGYSCAAGWLADALEVAEVHVHPGYQHRGIGRGMLLALTARRTESTAVLSTADADSTARRLYRGLGFRDLLTGYSFPGGGQPYAVMGAVLPLRDVPGAGATRAADVPGTAPGG